MSNLIRLVIALPLWASFLLCFLSFHAWADDLLSALPTTTDSLQAKLGRLTRKQNENLKVPVSKNQVVLGISVREAGSQGSDAKPVSLFTAIADGRIVARNYAPLSAEPKDGRVSEEELRWLIHLAVNECEAMSRSTDEMRRNYEAIPKLAQPTAWFRFDVAIEGKQNSFEIPYEALTVRPIRNHLELDPFASLLAYTGFLTSRAYLGNSESQQLVLQRVNETLDMKGLDGRPYGIEDLISAGETRGEVNAVFEQRAKVGADIESIIKAFYQTTLGQREIAVEIETMQRAVGR